MTKTKIDTPRPCPFCGGKAELVNVEPDPETMGIAFSTWQVECSQCHTTGPSGGAFDRGKENAVQAWNGRMSAKRIRQIEEATPFVVAALVTRRYTMYVYDAISKEEAIRLAEDRMDDILQYRSKWTEDKEFFEAEVTTAFETSSEDEDV